MQRLMLRIYVYMNKTTYRFFTTFCILTLCSTFSTFAQIDSTVMRKEKVCYSLTVNSKEYGIYKDQQVYVDSILKINSQFLFTCDMTKLFEVKNQNSWKTFYILSTDETDSTIYTYSCLGTDSKKYVFILDLDTHTITKMYEDIQTYIELNAIESLRVIEN